MNREIWLPLTTLVLGWAGAQVTEMLKDRRVSDRERSSRRAQLQRTTLLDLQQALLEYYAETFRAWMTAFSTALSTEDETSDMRAPNPKVWGAWGSVVGAGGLVRLLVSRVDDEQLRRLAGDLLYDTPTARESDKERLERAYKKMGAGYPHAIDRIGELLRERY